MTPELDAIIDLQKSFMKSFAVLATQVIETQATVNVLLDIQRDRLIESGQSQQQADNYIQAHYDAHQKDAQNSLGQKLTQALGFPFDDIDFGGSAH